MSFCKKIMQKFSLCYYEILTVENGQDVYRHHCSRFATFISLFNSRVGRPISLA